MTQNYLNTEFKPGASVFTDLENNQPNTATFTASAVKANVAGAQVPMVRGSLALRKASTVTVCGMDCPPEIMESVTLSFNVARGAANLASLRLELNRLIDAAISEYGFSQGHVPPSYANFAAE